MKTFQQLSKGDKIYCYSEDCPSLGISEYFVNKIQFDSRFPESIYIDNRFFKRDKYLDEYGQSKYEGYRDFYATSKELLKPIIKANIERMIDEQIEKKKYADEKIERLRKELSEL